MNKNKIIFGIIGAIFLSLVIFAILNLKNSNELETKTNNSVFNIWIVGDEKSTFTEFVNDFKTLNTKYKNNNIVVESFSDYEEYYLALSASISKGKSPDLFVLNNSEKDPLFSDLVKGLNSEIINPNDFRKKYKGVFSDDLILSYTVDGKEKEFVSGIPVGYETLGIFYNGRYVKDSDLKSLSGLNNVISKLKESKPSLVPIGIGNGSTVYDAADIVTQFFMLENGVSKLTDVSGSKLKESLATYLLYGDENGNNGYNSRFSQLKSLEKDNLSLFSKGELFMVVGYPRMIKKIDENGYSTSLLRASPFPHYFSGDGKTLLNYNYFVLNKNTKNEDLAYDFLTYLNSDSGAQNYLDRFPYYLPGLLSLESDKLEEKINSKYKVVLGDFLDNENILSTFDKGIKNLYDRDIISILDNSSNYESEFNRFRNKIVCKAKKLTSFQNLSQSCE